MPGRVMVGRDWRRVLPLAACLLLMAIGGQARAQGPAPAADDRANEACHNKGSTVDIVACLDRLTAQWDRRLNAAYQAAMKQAEPEAATDLRAAERGWLEYRKQRCFYVGAIEGTIGQVIASDCFMRMTRARALEIVEDAKGLGG